VTAAGAAALGARVALIERHRLGGDCLNWGCVPSKALIRAARAAAELRDAHQIGVCVPAGARVDFAAIMQRMRRLRADLSPHDSADRFRQLGVDVYFGEARFTSPSTLAVESQLLTFRRAVIAVGGRPARAGVPGLDEAGFLTNETVFDLTELPRRLAVVGAGPIGCELAQAFARFGSQVHLFEMQHGVLPGEEHEASEIVRHSLERDGVKLLCCGRDLRVQKTAQGKQLNVVSHGQAHEVIVDEILVGAGRMPNVEGLNL
jgi:pyruvate/2-oxoglutarate dehydrogenase complex dihydrolipoamide dehydrogenase (E3) component